MAAKSNDVPSVPVPSSEAVVPPVEPAPAVAAQPAVPAPVVAPVESAPTAPRPDPYSAPSAAVTPPPGYSVPGTGPAPAYGSPAYGSPGYAVAPANGLSIGAMVTGIVGVLASLVSLGFLPALAAVIMGHIAQKRQPYAKPFWLTGIITGYVGVGISLLTGLFFLFFVIVGIGSASYFG